MSCFAKRTMPARISSFATCADRLAGDGTHTVATYMRQVRCKGLHQIEVQDSQGHSRCAVLELKYCPVRLLPPRAKQKRHSPLTLAVLQAAERDAPSGAQPIDCKLITDLPATSRAQVIEKLDWYAQRWKIETFHKILKSGCRAEDSRLRSAQRLTNLIAIVCILGWCIFWLTMINRAAPEVPATLALTPIEVELLDKLRPPRRTKVHHSEPSCVLSDPTRSSRRLPGSCLGSTAGQHRHLARHGPLDQH